MLDSLLDQLAAVAASATPTTTIAASCGTQRRDEDAILAAMGCNVTDAGAVEREIAALDAERWQPHAPAVTVLRPGRTGVIVVAPADALGEAIDWRVTTAQGTNRDVARLPANWPKSSGMNRTAAGLRDAGCRSRRTCRSGSTRCSCA